MASCHTLAAETQVVEDELFSYIWLIVFNQVVFMTTCYGREKSKVIKRIGESAKNRIFRMNMKKFK